MPLSNLPSLIRTSLIYSALPQSALSLTVVLSQMSALSLIICSFLKYPQIPGIPHITIFAPYAAFWHSAHNCLSLYLQNNIASLNSSLSCIFSPSLRILNFLFLVISLCPALILHCSHLFSSFSLYTPTIQYAGREPELFAYFESLYGQEPLVTVKLLQKLNHICGSESGLE